MLDGEVNTDAIAFALHRSGAVVNGCTNDVPVLLAMTSSINDITFDCVLSALAVLGKPEYTLGTWGG